MTETFYNCESAPKYYVGVYAVPYSREVFKFHHDPTEEDGLPYVYVIGPFRTKRGACFMAEYGRNNSHCQHVDDAERLARKYAREEQS